jgi:hypothetical protein
MIELRTAATKFLVPLTVTLSTLPIFSFDDSELLPSSTYTIFLNDAHDINWDNYDCISPLQKSQDEINYETISNFASKLVNDTSDIPPEFAKVLVNDFWNLV